MQDLTSFEEWVGDGKGSGVREGRDRNFDWNVKVR